MVGYVTLTDRGKYDVSETLPDAGDEEQAFGSAGTEGTVLNLHINSVSFDWEAMINDEAQPAKKNSNNDLKRFVLGEVDRVGIFFPVWRIKGVFDMSLTTTDARDYGRLCHMLKTKGVKRLGVDAIATAEIISYRDYGEREYDAQGTKTILYVTGHITKLRCNQETSVSKKLNFELEFIESA